VLRRIRRRRQVYTLLYIVELGESFMAEQNIESLCGECGETFSNFLQEMADQNAKVATCPKCGKIHAVSPPPAPQPVVKARSAKKRI
jgi:ribosomal protein S27AE